MSLSGDIIVRGQDNLGKEHNIIVRDTIFL